MDTIRHAVVGCGVIGPLHADSIAKLDGSTLAVCCDVVAERAQAMAEKHGAEAATDFAAVLGRDDIDLVHICTPSGLHADMAVEALAAGKHVITEKPMDITVAACQKLIDAAAESDRKVTCIFQNRFLFPTQKVKEAVSSGLLGKLNMGDAYIKWYRTQGYYDSGDWRATWGLDGGGCLMNQGVHYVDLLQWYMGEVESVYAICDTLSHDIEVEDVAAAVLRFRSGAIGVIEGSTSATPGLDWRIELHGDQGSVSLRNGKIDQWRFLDKELDRKPPTDAASEQLKAAGADPTSLPAQAHELQIELMCRALRTGGEVPVPVKEARNAVEIINAIYESSRRNEPVHLPLRPRLGP